MISDFFDDGGTNEHPHIWNPPYVNHFQVKKLWRWRPATAANPSEDPPDPSTALEAFMKGLSMRLGLGEGSSGLRVRSVMYAILYFPAILFFDR